MTNGRSDRSLYLVDTSAWIDVLVARRGSEELRARLDTLALEDALATTGMVRFEILSGTRSRDEWDRLASRLAGLIPFAFVEQHWTEAARLGFDLRRQGFTIPTPDLIIAAVAMAHDATVLHRDRHFDLIAEHTPLRVESHVVPDGS